MTLQNLLEAADELSAKFPLDPALSRLEVAVDELRNAKQAKTELVARLAVAYDRVKEWPEHSPTGFMDLLALRNLVPEAIAALQKELGE